MTKSKKLIRWRCWRSSWTSPVFFFVFCFLFFVFCFLFFVFVKKEKKKKKKKKEKKEKKKKKKKEEEGKKKKRKKTQTNSLNRLRLIRRLLVTVAHRPRSIWGPSLLLGLSHLPLPHFHLPMNRQRPQQKRRNFTSSFIYFFRSIRYHAPILFSSYHSMDS